MNLSFEIFGQLRITVNITGNPYEIAPRRLFTMAARKNPKRSFLFVSRILGKHLPVSPGIPLIFGRLLAARYWEECHGDSFPGLEKLLSVIQNGHDPESLSLPLEGPPLLALPEPTVFMGFAETATAMGHAVFASFKNAWYIHTTRERIVEHPGNLAFEEEHCHATSHRVYPLNLPPLRSPSPIVLIDDEITTGKTALNTVRAIHRFHQRCDYTVLSLLDWRKREDMAAFKSTEEELGVRIRTVSLLKGNFEVRGAPPSPRRTFSSQGAPPSAPPPTVEAANLSSLFRNCIVCCSSMDSRGNRNPAPYVRGTGRFGLQWEENLDLEDRTRKAGLYLGGLRTGKRTLCIGTGEFMYIPMKISSHMGKNVLYQSTTRSPIHPRDREGYGARNGFVFSSPDDPDIVNYLYNIPPGRYDELFLFFERKPPRQRIASLLEQLRRTGIPKMVLVHCSEAPKLPEPEPLGSYSPRDAVFLLKDVSGLILEQGNEERERAIQSGVHYSEMIPVEYKPSPAYMDLFHSSLRDYGEKIALATGVVAEKILKARGPDMVLASLARAGTPAGVLVSRYLRLRYGLELPHYSISIIRGKGVDENALLYILRSHPRKDIQFLDGWTGKGAITRELHQACDTFEKRWGVRLHRDMAVIADPGYCAPFFGTREDFLIPSACLNSTVSGLVSRTIHRKDLVGPHDFHGVKFYRELADEDVSNLFVDTVSRHFQKVAPQVEQRLACEGEGAAEVTWLGMRDVERIRKDFSIENVHFVKPGIGETTRVLLRRIPWKVLVRPGASHLDHVLQLAREKDIPVEEYPLSAYHCCGLIKALERSP